MSTVDTMGYLLDSIDNNNVSANFGVGESA